MGRRKTRCWTFRKVCADGECAAEFEIRLEMGDREAAEFNRRAALCRDCTRRRNEEAVRQAEEKGRFELGDGESVKVTAKDPKDDEKAEKVERLINSETKKRAT